MPRLSGSISPHFTWEEAQCRCGCLTPLAVVEEVRQTALWAERVRTALGDYPMHILSWYRCPAYNAKIGGVPNSQHLLGRAIDFSMRPFGPRQLQEMLVQQKLYPTLIHGLGKYLGFTHIDRRVGPVAMWTPATRAQHA